MKAFLLILALSLPAAAFAQSDALGPSLCNNTKENSKAGAVLQKVRSKLQTKAPALNQANTSSGTDNCDSASLSKAANPNPLQDSRRVGPFVCGAYFTFKTPEQTRAFAQWALKNFNHKDTSRICARTEFIRPEEK